MIDPKRTVSVNDLPISKSLMRLSDRSKKNSFREVLPISKFLMRLSDRSKKNSFCRGFSYIKVFDEVK